MRRGRRFLMLLALGGGLAACAGTATISPNDLQYAQSGAPRVGEPPPPQSGSYSPLGSSGCGGGM